MSIPNTTERGSVLMTTLVFLALVGLTAVAYLALASQQNILTMRSQVWAWEIPLAEAGIEEALVHINSHPGSFGADGWTLSGSNYVKSRTLGDGYYYTMISASTPPVIVSIGYGRVPLQTNHSRRVVMVTTKATGFGYSGLTAKDSISMNGNTTLDSFNSTNSLFNTGGQYDKAKNKDGATISCLSAKPGAIDMGNGKIYGSLASAPGGTASFGPNGGVGDFDWFDNNKGGIQPGHFKTDLNISIPDVSPPFAGGYFTPGGGTVGGVTYTYVLGSGDYLLSSLSGTTLVNGKARLYVTESTTLSGITIAPGGSLQLYLAGPSANLKGNGISNVPGLAKNLAIYGLPSLTSITLGGNTAFIGTIYAPEADLDMHGTPAIVGAAVVRTFTLKGTADFHFDESLGGALGGGSFAPVSWEEL